MRISIDTNRNEFEPALDWVSGIIGSLVDKRVAAFTAQERNNPLLAAHFKENFELEFTLAKARKYRNNTGRLPKGPIFDRLFGFLVPAQRMHGALPHASRQAFEGRLREAINGMHGARPFAYEITVAGHLMNMGWDVDFADYAGVARFDLLARKEATEIEVECKTTSNDTGRKIHRQEANRLGDILLPLTKQLGSIDGCHFIKVSLADRLQKSESELLHIASLVEIAVRNSNESVGDDLVRVEYRFEELHTWPEDPSRDPVARLYFEARLGISNASLVFHVRPKHAIVAIAIASVKPDAVIDTIAEEAKTAAKQCTGNRPALIALHLVEGIRRPDLETLLRTPNGLHDITHAVFKNDARRHVDSVAFTIPQTWRQDGDGSLRLGGQVLTLNNPSPKFPCDEIRTIFR